MRLIGLLPHILLAFAGSLLWAGAAANAQVTGGPIRRDSGPLRERSTNVGAGSGPVRDSGGSVYEGSGGTIGGNSVRGSVSGDLHSGPVSDISRGPVTSDNPVFGGGSVSEGSAGAVTKDASSPIRASIAQPVQGLEGLQRQLQEIQPLPREELPVEEQTGEATPEVPTPEEPPEQNEVPRVTPEAVESIPEAEVPAAEAPEEQAPEEPAPEVP